VVPNAGRLTVGVRTARSVVTIYGAPDNLEDLQGTAVLTTGQTVTYQSVEGMVWEPGSAVFGCAVAGGVIVVGSLTASGNSFQESYIDSTFHIFDPRHQTWTVVTMATDLGQTGVTGSDGFGTGDWWPFAVTGGKIIGLSAKDYSDWVIATHGRYPAWIEVDPSTKTVSRSKTIPQLRADAADGDGALSFPDAVNVHAETYAANMVMSAADVMPNGWTVVTDYVTPSGNSGRIKVLDADGVEQGFYQYPDMQTEDGELLTVAPVGVSSDPTSDLDDMRFVVCFDIFLRGTATQRPFMVQEMACDDTGVITPVSAPVGSVVEDETADWSDNLAMAGGRMGRDGTFWMVCGSRSGFGFSQQPLGAWFKTAGERRWTAENPPSAGWENRLGENRLVPDAEFGVLEKASSIGSGIFFDDLTGGVIIVGFSGRIFPFIPDSPLVLRASVLSNSTFAANITGWNVFGATCAAVHDAGDGGRLMMTANGTATSCIVQTDTGSTYSPLPANSVGQSWWPWAEVKSSTARRARITVNFVDDDENPIGSTVSGPWAYTNTAGYVKVTCPVEVPVGATQYKLIVIVNQESGGNMANGEIHYMREAYGALAPATHKPEANLDLSQLPNGTADVTWPAGVGVTCGEDSGRAAWCPIRCLENSGTAQPQPMPQYLMRLDMPQLLGESTPSRVIRLAGTEERPRINFVDWAAFVDLTYGTATAADVGERRLLEAGSIDRRLLESGDDRLLEA
jgi:hypothetical protein